MYAIVKTGGKQYKVAAGDILTVEKLDTEEGKKVALEAICVVDGEKVEADPAKASKTKVEAVVLEQFKGDKQLVFKFKKRKNYKKLRGHRQNLTKIQIESVGTEKAAKKATTAKSTTAKKTTAAAKSTTAKTTEAKSTTAKKTATTAKKAAPKKETAEKKPAAKKTTTKAAASKADAE